MPVSTREKKQQRIHRAMSESGASSAQEESLRELQAKRATASKGRRGREKASSAAGKNRAKRRSGRARASPPEGGGGSGGGGGLRDGGSLNARSSRFGDDVDTVIVELGATSKKEMGAVMKEVKARTEGRADGKVVSGIVATRLS